jgi:hypothetical protein
VKPFRMSPLFKYFSQRDKNRDEIIGQNKDPKIICGTCLCGSLLRSVVRSMSLYLHTLMDDNNTKCCSVGNKFTCRSSGRRHKGHVLTLAAAGVRRASLAECTNGGV